MRGVGDGNLSHRNQTFYESEGKREGYSCTLFEFASDSFGGQYKFSALIFQESEKPVQFQNPFWYLYGNFVFVICNFNERFSLIAFSFKTVE